MKWCVLFIVLVFGVNLGLSKYNNAKNLLARPQNAAKTFEYNVKNNVISIPVMVHLDSALTHKLPKKLKIKKREKIKKFIKSILNRTQNTFLRPSLNQTISFSIVDIKFLNNSTKKFVMEENISKYLKSYCQWQGEKKREKKRWWYSVLFTGMDLFYYRKDNSRVGMSTGRSYMNGLCSPAHSCAILELHRSDNIHQKLAHEIAHSLGISHDSTINKQCDGNYIMSSKYRRNHKGLSWSRCSKHDLHKFLNSPLSWCIKPSPGYE